MSFLYKLGLIFVTATLVILPLIYLALIAAVAWGTSYCSTQCNPSGHGSRSDRVGLFFLLTYITPVFAGLVLVLFIVKPRVFCEA